MLAVNQLRAEARDDSSCAHDFFHCGSTGCGKTPNPAFRGRTLPKESAFFLGIAKKQIPRSAQDDNWKCFFRNPLRPDYPLDLNVAAARMIRRKPAEPSSMLAVATPPINAPMTPSIAASAPVRYRFRIGVLGAIQVFRY